MMLAVTSSSPRRTRPDMGNPYPIARGAGIVRHFRRVPARYAAVATTPAPRCVHPRQIPHRSLFWLKTRNHRRDLALSAWFEWGPVPRMAKLPGASLGSTARWRAIARALSRKHRVDRARIEDLPAVLLDLREKSAVRPGLRLPDQYRQLEHRRQVRR